MIRICSIFLFFITLTMPVKQALSGEWPREFVNVDGSTTMIPKKPQRIVSTAVTVTGTLIAMDANVVASATGGHGRYFYQWREEANKRNIAKLWPVGGVDIEMVYAYMPDLIVVASNGGDSTKAQFRALSQIAPTIMVDYGGQTWQSLAKQLASATGDEAVVEQRIADFDQILLQAKAKIHPPATRANIISYNGPGIANPIAEAESAHGELLHALGFSIEQPDARWDTHSDKRSDFVWSHYENLTRLTAPMTFLIVADDKKAQQMMSDPVLANMPSVKAHQVYGLGLNSFRMDYFSAREVVDNLVRYFGQDK